MATATTTTTTTTTIPNYQLEYKMLEILVESSSFTGTACTQAFERVTPTNVMQIERQHLQMAFAESMHTDIEL